MTIREKMDTLLKKYPSFKKYNPEMVDAFGFRFVVIFQSGNENEPEEVTALLAAAERETFEFILIFDSLEEKQHLLLGKIQEIQEESNWVPVVITLFHDQEKETFVPVTAIVENGKLSFKDIYEQI